MKRIIVMVVLLLSSVIYPQLKSLEVKPTENRGQIPVLTEYPDKAGLYFYTSFDNLKFVSSYGINKIYNRSIGNYIVIVEPTRQSIEISAPGYKTEIIKITDLSPREFKYYTVEPKKEEKGIGGVKELAVTVLATPKDAEISIDGKPFKNDSPTIVSIGEHELRVVKVGYNEYKEKIVVSPSQTLFKIQMKEKELVKVEIKSDPTGAEIVIDGIKKGKTPAERYLNPGEYTIKLEMSGYDTKEEILKVSENEIENKKYYILEKNMAEVLVEILPKESIVYLNKEKIENNSSNTVLPGLVTIEAECKGYKSIKEKIEIKKGEKKVVVYQLNEKVGKLVESTDPIESRSKLKRGEEIVMSWEGGKKIENIREGTYTLEVSSAGYTTITKVVDIEEGKTTIEEIYLQKEVKAEVKRERKSSTTTDNFVYVEGGTFQMGSNDGPSDEKPIHSVTLSSFYISKYEVTVKEYKAYCTATGKSMPSAPKWGWNDNDPIVNVSWNDAVAYCTWAGVRLPTEAEWEYAVRGGNKSRGYTYSGSNNIGDVAWYRDNSNSKVHPAGAKSPNEIGLYDMSGNVCEWCNDWYDEKYYQASPSTNPTGPSTGTNRVFRGCSWLNNGGNCRSAIRGRNVPDNRYYFVGFRVARLK